VHPVLFHIGSILIPAYGALAAVGVLLGMVLAQRTARLAGIDPNKVWNLCIVALFTAIVGSRLLLIAVNWSVLRSHPAWMLGLAMIHHPLLAAAGGALALVVAWGYARRQRMPLLTTADVLAPPLTLALAFEQIGALLAGSGYGTGTNLPFAVIYSSPLAARWSGAPIGIPVHPVQAYAALAFLTIAIGLVIWFPVRRQQGDVAGVCLMATGVALYITEFWRDPIGRGALLGGFLRGPQAAAVGMVVAGGLLLAECESRRIHDTYSPVHQSASGETTEKGSIHG
jgi:phosphatidylglycerol:prolipoprotein diacylglycerol transferase